MLKTFLKTLFLGLLLSVPAAADWQAKDASGTNIIFDAFLNSGKQLPKHAIVDQSGNRVGTNTSPLFVQLNAGTALVGSLQLSDGIGGVNKAAIDNTGRLSVNAGTVSANTLVGGNPASSSNPVPTTCIAGCVGDSAAATYGAGGEVTALPASASDYVNIQGSSTRIVKIRAIRISLNNATNSNVGFRIVRRSTGNSGGTTSVITPTNYDVNDPTSTVTVIQQSTAATSLGTLVGYISYHMVTASLPASFRELIYGDRGAKPIYLRGNGDFISIYLDPATSGIGFRWSVEWTEE
jgi:hypothetical protein